MPPVNTHCQISLARTGREFRELHEWLDNDPAHKTQRHDLNRVLENARQVEEAFSPDACQELVQHLLDDLKAKINHALAEGPEAVNQALAQLGVR